MPGRAPPPLSELRKGDLHHGVELRKERLSPSGREVSIQGPPNRDPWGSKDGVQPIYQPPGPGSAGHEPRKRSAATSHLSGMAEPEELAKERRKEEHSVVSKRIECLDFF